MSITNWLSDIKQKSLHWVRENPLSFVLLLLFPLLFLGLLILLALLAGFSVIGSEIFGYLIEVDTTIIAFFGAVYVFALTSVNKRIDERQNQIVNLQISKSNNYTTIRNLTKQIDILKEEKSKMVNSAIYVGFLLFSSLISAILASGFRTIEDGWMSMWLSYFSFFTMILGFTVILWEIYDFKKNPQD